MKSVLWRQAEACGVVYTEDREHLRRLLALEKFPVKREEDAATYKNRRGRVFAWQATFDLSLWRRVVRALGREEIEIRLEAEARGSRARQAAPQGGAAAQDLKPGRLRTAARSSAAPPASRPARRAPRAESAPPPAAATARKPRPAPSARSKAAEVPPAPTRPPKSSRSMNAPPHARPGSTAPQPPVNDKPGAPVKAAAAPRKSKHREVAAQATRETPPAPRETPQHGMKKAAARPTTVTAAPRRERPHAAGGSPPPAAAAPASQPQKPARARAAAPGAASSALPAGRSGRAARTGTAAPKPAPTASLPDQPGAAPRRVNKQPVTSDHAVAASAADAPTVPVRGKESTGTAGRRSHIPEHQPELALDLPAPPDRAVRKKTASTPSAAEPKPPPSAPAPNRPVRPSAAAIRPGRLLPAPEPTLPSLSNRKPRPTPSR